MVICIKAFDVTGTIPQLGNVEFRFVSTPNPDLTRMACYSIARKMARSMPYNPQCVPTRLVKGPQCASISDHRITAYTSS